MKTNPRYIPASLKNEKHHHYRYIGTLKHVQKQSRLSEELFHGYLHQVFILGHMIAEPVRGNYTRLWLWLPDSVFEGEELYKLYELIRIEAHMMFKHADDESVLAETIQ